MKLAWPDATLVFRKGSPHITNLLLSEVIFGGVGAGMYGILIYVVLSVFIAGLMVGRTPEYMGKKVEAYDVKMAMLNVLIFPLSILVFTAISSVSPGFGTSQLNNAGPHGLSEILYAFTSGTGNNGSAFAGISANTYWYNTTIGFAMLLGRFFMIIPTSAGRPNRSRARAESLPSREPVGSLWSIARACRRLLLSARLGGFAGGIGSDCGRVRRRACAR
jgi:potassium-transporting ATPase potassium-binding subunit